MAVTRAKDLEALERKLAKLRRSAARAGMTSRIASVQKQIERAKALRAKEVAATEKRLSSLTSSFNRSADRIRARAEAREATARARRERANERRAARAERLKDQIAKAGG